MKFSTPVSLPKGELDISYASRLLVMGSCFATNMGTLMQQNKLCCEINPFGVLYNPFSISEALVQLCNKRLYSEADLVETSRGWHSWMHHSCFSASSSKDCLQQINNRMLQASEFIRRASLLVITWGTAWAYFLKETGICVGNCHKMPDKIFTRRLLTVDEIVKSMQQTLYAVRCINPQLQVLFTVSPIRHIKDGFHGNQISKATLILAIDRLCKEVSGCFYFPSYEIMLDELRDYRFYADDMCHPSSLAIEYLWDCFSRSYFSEETKKVMAEWQLLYKSLQHKPFEATSVSYYQFVEQLAMRLQEFQQRFPNIELKNELQQCQNLLNTYHKPLKLNE